MNTCGWRSCIFYSSLPSPIPALWRLDMGRLHQSWRSCQGRREHGALARTQSLALKHPKATEGRFCFWSKSWQQRLAGKCLTIGGHTCMALLKLLRA